MHHFTFCNLKHWIILQVLCRYLYINKDTLVFFIFQGLKVKLKNLVKQN